MKDTIYLPKKIKVGFNPRSDTYTGLLGYVIYHDGKVWRKETSWKGWIYNFINSKDFKAKKKASFDKRVEYSKKYHDEAILAVNQGKAVLGSHQERISKITLKEYLSQSNITTLDEYQPHDLGKLTDNENMIPRELENIPMEGFVLNRKAGGSSSGWNHRATYCRVYDPRGFEFEISIPNLLYILENATSIKGKGLTGKFVYGWYGKDLVLVPEEAPEYAQMLEFTALKAGKVYKKDLVEGGKYMDSNMNELVYMEQSLYYNYSGRASSVKVLWFYNIKADVFSHYSMTSIKKDLKELVDNYADLYTNLQKESTHTPPVISEVTYEAIPVLDIPSLLNKRRRYNEYITVFIQNPKSKKFKEVRLFVKDYDGVYKIKTPTWRNSKILFENKLLTELIKESPIYKEIVTKVKQTN